jgi:hypothetical protein
LGNSFPFVPPVALTEMPQKKSHPGVNDFLSVQCLMSVTSTAQDNASSSSLNQDITKESEVK